MNPLARRSALVAAATLLAGLAWAAFVPVRFASREEVFEIPKGTWARRMAGDPVEILPARIDLVLKPGPSALGAEVAPGLHEAELHYLHEHEWARSADDVLWRRSKLGLHMNDAQRRAVADWCRTHWPDAATPLAPEPAWN